MQLLKALWALAGAALCCFLVLVIHAQFLKEGQLAAGTCEIVTLDRDSSQPRRTIARQTARCACRKGQIAGTTRARPACVDGLLTIAAPAVPPGSGRGSLEILHLSHRPPCCVDTAHSPPPSSTHCSPAA
ncbi:chemokine-like protein TAFA-5 isoform X4 [Meriones unguiculatus]|uniref:chemokine-like protein TAFA-5 isoform X4 n=1 Tax=Meriones unguiculatus TaxID=10047 RepID=UPI000B4F563B|nr:chemokine-like protein TAFA-5 isoform X4 [Meriones unguiculatus]